MQKSGTQTRSRGDFGVHLALRQKPMRSVLLILCLACASVSALFAPGTKHETMTGRVVAYSDGLVCLNGNAYWSMVIRVQKPKNARSQFIRVDFTLPCDKSPQWASAKGPIQKFHLARRQDCDEVLGGSIAGEPNPNLVLPIWNHPPGTENETLPFGQVLPCYRSLDLPFVPVV